MNFGEAWVENLGICHKDTAFEIMDYFFESGGNFIDTSNNYQNEQSEQWVGEWMAKRDVREQMVIATKFTTNFQAYKGFEGRINSVFGGNSTKSLHVSVEASLKKLQTSYIDILYVHWWDCTTSIPELMLSLNQLLNAGKVLYLGASDLPAYVVAKANQYARDHGLRGFVVYQGRWSAANRDFERDIMPLAREDGMALAPWGALGGGHFKSKAQMEEYEKTKDGRAPYRPNPNAAAVTPVFEKIAERKNTIITSVALAYVMHKTPYVFPIVGGRKLNHIKSNVEALSVELSDEDIKEIEDSYEFDLGFPGNIFGGAEESNWLMNTGGTFDYVQREKPIKPAKMM